MFWLVWKRMTRRLAVILVAKVWLESPPAFSIFFFRISLYDALLPASCRSQPGESYTLAHRGTGGSGQKTTSPVFLGSSQRQQNQSFTCCSLVRNYYSAGSGGETRPSQMPFMMFFDIVASPLHGTLKSSRTQSSPEQVD
jgi:hypothetical protein